VGAGFHCNFLADALFPPRRDYEGDGEAEGTGDGQYRIEKALTGCVLHV
jgi:hypothetical protein